MKRLNYIIDICLSFKCYPITAYLLLSEAFLWPNLCFNENKQTKNVNDII